jgi:hypothetical protein
VYKKTTKKKDWWSGSSGRAPAEQAQSPEYKPQLCKKEKEKRKKVVLKC